MRYVISSDATILTAQEKVCYFSARAVEKAGAEAEIFVVRNLTAEDVASKEPEELKQIIEDALYMTNAVESKKASLIIGLSALVIAGGLSLFASSHPDGLEWSIASITGSTEIKEKNKYSVKHS